MGDDERARFVYDRDVKLQFYAESGIPEVWIVDLHSARVLVYREPSGLACSQRLVVGREGRPSPLPRPDLVLPVESLLG